MEKERICNIFKHFRGSIDWAAEELCVARGTISAWVNGRRTYPTLDLDTKMAALAERLIDSNGGCMFPPFVDSVRSALSLRSHIKKIKHTAKGS